jgi:hypothetical protein
MGSVWGSVCASWRPFCPAGLPEKLSECQYAQTEPTFHHPVGDRVIEGSNLGFDARYDQILHRATIPENFSNKGGALDFYIDDASIEALFPGKDYSRTKFTYQMSDHLPIWIQVKTDIDGFRLDQIVQEAGE